MDETRCLSLPEMLVDARAFWLAAKERDDIAAIALWGEALDCLLDRM